MGFKQKKIASPKNKYLKPGSLAQICNSRTTNRSCAKIGKKRIALKSETEIVDVVQHDEVTAHISTKHTSPIQFSHWSTPDAIKQRKCLGTSKSPEDVNCSCQSRLESLPLDILVEILCNLRHDQLKAVFHVSQQIRAAVLLAKQLHFNYTTPDRSRRELLSTKTPFPTVQQSFPRKGILSPHTPKAPRHASHYPRIQMDMKQIGAVLFQESILSPRLLMPTRLRPICRPVSSTRVLFYEDELCQAVTQHKLR